MKPTRKAMSISVVVVGEKEGRNGQGNFQDTHAAGLSEQSCQKGITRMSKKPTIGRRLCTLAARISFLIHCKFEEKTT